MAANASGGICACGTATKDGIQLYDVWAAVFGPGTLASIPGSHTAAPMPTQCKDFDDQTGDWRFVGNNLVAAVPCSANQPNANNATFVVWCTFADATGTEFPMGRDIAAHCSNQTNCDGTGPSPCADDLQIVTAGAGAKATVTLETAPRQYQVQGKSARGPLASLVNTSWLLSLRTGGCGCSAVWINEGDGLRLPHVKLRPDNLVASKWHLTLTFKGRRLHYSCPARDWSPLGANRLVLAEPSDGDGLPETLTVSPV